MSWIEATVEETVIQPSTPEGAIRKRGKFVYEYTFLFKVEQQEEIVGKIRQLIDQQREIPYHRPVNNIKIIRMKLVSSCIGCREDQPNQQAHMDPGGCLYVD